MKRWIGSLVLAALFLSVAGYADPASDDEVSKAILMLHHEDPVVQAYGTAILRKEGLYAQPAVNDLVKLLGNTTQLQLQELSGIVQEETTLGQEAAKTLVIIGRPAVPELLNALRNYQDWYRQGWAARVLGRIGDREPVELLIAVMENRERAPYAWPRRQSAWALGKIGDRRAVGPLARALTDVEIRYDAVQAIKGMRATRALGPLLEAMEKDKIFAQDEEVISTLQILRAQKKKETKKTLTVALSSIAVSAIFVFFLIKYRRRRPWWEDE